LQKEEENEKELERMPKTLMPYRGQLKLGMGNPRGKPKGDQVEHLRG